jgi:hypothetical protein
LTKDQLTILRLYSALKTITRYQTPDQLRGRSEKDYGLDYEEALGYAYENIQQTAKNAIKGVRRPKDKTVAPETKGDAK